MHLIGLHLTGLHLIGVAGRYFIGLHLAGGASHRQYLIDAYDTSAHLRGRRTFVPIEQAAWPAGVLCNVRWVFRYPRTVLVPSKPQLTLGERRRYDD